MSEYLISIIMPVYNEGSNIKGVFDSFLNQDCMDYEMIIVDDGSTDECAGICDEYSRKHDNFRVYHRENNGCVFARKYGIEKATGKYIVFADGDDYVEKDYIYNIKKAVQNKADYYILNNKLRFIGKKIDTIEKNFIKDGYISIDAAYEYVLSAKAAAVWDKIFVADKLKIILNDLLAGISYGEDVYINLKYISNANICNVYCQNTSSYVHVADSLTSICTHNINKKRFIEINTLFEAVLDERNNSGKIQNLIFKKYCSITVFNLLLSVYALTQQKYKRKQLKVILDNLSCYHYLCNKYVPYGLKNKIYLHALRNMNMFLIICIFQIKSKLWRKSHASEFYYTSI